jgi:predicted RNA-binding Zn ribbon-like protein
MAVDFANTRACPACRAEDPLDSAKTWHQWRTTHGVRATPRFSRAEREQLSRFREDICIALDCAIDGCRPAAALLGRFQRALEDGRLQARVGWTTGRWRYVEAVEARGPVEWWRAVVTRSAIDLLQGPGVKRLRHCQGLGCRHYLIARRTGQLWCSPTGCGNRARVARHYRRFARRVRREGTTPVARRRARTGRPRA